MVQQRELEASKGKDILDQSYISTFEKSIKLKRQFSKLNIQSDKEMNKMEFTSEKEFSTKIDTKT